MSRKNEEEPALTYTPPSSPEVGLCQCGCGGRAPIASQSSKKRGWTKGKPLLFIHGHNNRKSLEGCGYKTIKKKGHHRAKKDNGHVLKHLIIAERALGKPIKKPVVVHHHNPKQLVICQDQAYHMLLHQRMRALRVCGNVHWRKCKYCKNYDDPSQLNTDHTYHRECKNECDRQRRAK